MSTSGYLKLSGATQREQFFPFATAEGLHAAYTAACAMRRASHEHRPLAAVIPDGMHVPASMRADLRRIGE